MGYGGKYEERERARQLRAQSWTLQAIADELGVAKGTVSVWVRDVDHVPNPRNRGHPSHKPHPLTVKKAEQLRRLREDAKSLAETLGHSDLTMFCLGLYAGEGTKTSSSVGLANTNPLLLRVFLSWLRAEFAIDESRLRCVIYLHEGLDIDAATVYWSELLQIPRSQFTKPYRALADPSRRAAKHVHGCATVRYSCTGTLRTLLAMIEAVSFRFADPG
jgi:transcriptional regulator with XRE-family HTH domain